MKPLLFNLIVILTLSSCVSLPVNNENNKIQELTVFPVSPALITYSAKPVVNKVGNNFEVTGELIENTTLMFNYINKISSWKQINNIK